LLLFARIAGLAVLAALVAGLMSVPLLAQDRPDRTAEIRSRFSREPDPVRKAKMLPQLSDSEFRQVQPLLAAGNLTEASAIAHQLADEAESAVKGLDARGRDPEQHAEGYRQAEISVRISLRRMDDILVGLSAEDQKPFIEVRHRLDDLERHLIRELFPHRPDAPAAAEPKS
jgi:hypothetical protein